MMEIADGMECMVVDADKEIDDNTDDECVYECDFDINDVINSTLSNLDVTAQVQEAIVSTNAMLSIVTQKYHYTSLVFAGLDADMKSLKSNIDIQMTASLISQTQPVQPQNMKERSQYQYSRPSPTPVVVQRKKAAEPSEVVTLARIVSKSSVLPPTGPLVKKDLVIGCHVYALKGSVYGAWYKAKVVDIKFNNIGEKHYKIKYDSRKQMTQLSAKNLAYHDPADVMLHVGVRIIAQYRDETWSLANLMYSGIIAEPAKMMNGYRYLVFFDDGYAQYVSHNEIRVVCESNKEVWHDIPIDSKDFIKKYLGQYPERPMVKLQKGHTVKTEWNGRWWIAKVVEVDGSLAKMYFHADKRTEWIYRGSTRLGPLYSELANAEAIRLSGKGSRRHNLSFAKKSAPYVEYTRGSDDPSNSSAAQDSANAGEEKRQVARKHTFQIKQNVARKSTTSIPTTFKSVNPASLPENEGETCLLSFNTEYPTKKFTLHNCGPECLRDIFDEPIKHRGQNPLTIPLRYGWQRIVAKHKSTMKSYIFYRTPCGRRLRSMDEIHRYLVITKSLLAIDFFCTDSYVKICSEFVPTKVLLYIKDVSSGKELIPVCGVNSLKREYPDYVEYSNQRIPNKGVDLNLDPEFLICCDCIDDCSDPDLCACQQLTIEASKAAPGGRIKANPGYTYRKLKEGVITGIYECNHRCKCNSRCLNRVVQNGLQLRLQIYKTEKRGWGIRCLDDIPHGGFVCIYAGQLLTEQGANEDGTQYGDEYLAELDYIEVVERMKEDYESDVIESDADENDKDKKERSGSDEDMGKDESDEYVLDGDKNDTSDSDFESGISAVEPRTLQTRGMEKLQKLVLRREPSDADSSNQSWNVHPSGGRSPSSDISSREADENRLTPSVVNPSPINREGNYDIGTVNTKEVISVGSSSDTSESFKGKKDTSAKRKREQDLSEGKPEEEKNSSKDKCRSFADPMGRENGGRGKWKPTRSYFGDEFCYIMDAKSLGNIGRYLNHNCAPNVFVQNVFVDTHDLRFPWVAFFALQHIRAGTELTWDYNYEVGSVPNKVMYCYCGADKCKGRLL